MWINPEFVAKHAEYFTKKENIQVMLGDEMQLSALSEEQKMMFQFDIDSANKAILDLDVVVKLYHGMSETAVVDWIKNTVEEA